MDTPAAWHRDPTGRHEARYWDGARWTDSVADTGVTSVDPPTWPPALAGSGLGLRSGVLRVTRLRSDGWPVHDGAGVQVGWVVPGPFRIGSKSAEVWDLANNRWLRLTMSISGSRILVDEAEVGRISWHGIGGLSSVDLSLDLAGRQCASLRAGARELLSGTATAVDPGGTALLSVMTGPTDLGPAITVTRLVTFPDQMERLVLALPPALILQFEDRAAFRMSNRDIGSARSGSGVWPGL